MNSIFHYYGMQFLARRAGFSSDESEILSYSCAYLDSNVVPLRLELPSNKAYDTIVTHHFGFWDKDQEDAVWIPFHFFPGGSIEKNPELTVPNSEPAKELLVDALGSRNLYRIGIALHTFADTWAHQGFIGRSSPLNILSPHSPIPPIGHAQGGTNPDRWNWIWDDPRNQNPRIINRNRFYDAAKKIYRYLCTYQRQSFVDEEFVLDELESLLGKPPSKEFAGKSDEELALDFRGYLNLVPYNRGDWRREILKEDRSSQIDLSDENEKQRDLVNWIKNEALYKTSLARPRSYPVRNTFEKSHYFHWMESAKEQLESAKKIIRNI